MLRVGAADSTFFVNTNRKALLFVFGIFLSYPGYFLTCNEHVAHNLFFQGVDLHLDSFLGVNIYLVSMSVLFILNYYLNQLTVNCST